MKLRHDKKGSIYFLEDWWMEGSRDKSKIAFCGLWKVDEAGQVGLTLRGTTFPLRADKGKRKIMSLDGHSTV